MVAAFQVMESQNQLQADLHAENNYEGMKTTLKSIAAMQAQGQIDQNTIEEVTKTLKKINEELIDALDEDRKHSQSILDGAEAAIDLCDTNRQTWKDGAHATFNSDVTEENGEHDDCRVDKEQPACANATTHCDALTDQVCRWTDCVAPTAGFTGGDTDEVNDFMKCIGDFFDLHKTNYYQKRQNCIDATNSWNTITTECDGSQSDFEEEFCSREANTEHECENYRTCRNSAQSSYMKIKGEVEALEDIYQAQRVALECLLCYGNKILSNSTDLSSCEIATDCTDLTACPVIVYDKIAHCVSCTEPDDRRPCTQDFLDDWYAKFENTCTPPQQCNACAGTFDEGSLECDDCPTCPRAN